MNNANLITLKMPLCRIFTNVIIDSGTEQRNGEALIGENGRRTEGTYIMYMNTSLVAARK